MGIFGCKLTNGQGRDFMRDYDPDNGTNAAVRVSTRAMAQEVAAGHGPIAMDYSSLFYRLAGRRMWRRFLPRATWQRLNEFRLVEVGHDVRKKPEPFYALVFGIIGAVKAGVDCSTELPGLFAAGITLSQDPGKIKGCESARAMWSGERSGLSATRYLETAPMLDFDLDRAEEERMRALQPLLVEGDKTPDEILGEIQKVIFDYRVSILKRDERLREALNEVAAIEQRDLPRMRARDPHELVKYYGRRTCCCARSSSCEVVRANESPRGTIAKTSPVGTSKLAVMDQLSKDRRSLKFTGDVPAFSIP